MASLLVTRAAGGLRCAQPLSCSTLAASSRSRALHASPIVSARGAKIDQLFGDNWNEVEEDSLFTDTKKAAIAAEKAKATAAAAVVPKLKLKASKPRSERLEMLAEHFQKSLGKDVRGLPKTSTWSQMLHLADSKESLDKIVELFPLWRITPRTQRIPGPVVEHFVRRCVQLDTPETALHVLGDFGKYAIKPNLAAFQTLLYSLHTTRSLSDVLILASLMDFYELPPIESDRVSLSILICALIKDSSPRSKKTAEELVPKFADLLKRTGSVKVPSSAVDCAKEEEKWKFWLRRGVKQIHGWMWTTDKVRWKKEIAVLAWWRAQTSKKSKAWGLHNRRKSSARKAAATKASETAEVASEAAKGVSEAAGGASESASRSTEASSEGSSKAGILGRLFGRG